MSGKDASIGVPPEWLDLRPLVTDPAKRAEFEKAIQDQSTSPFIDSLAPEMFDLIDIIAVDGTTVTTGFATSVNVLVNKSGLIKDLDTVALLLPSQMSAVGGTIATTNRTQIGGFEMLVVDYTLLLPSGVEVTGRQYHRIDNRSNVVATFTAAAEEVDTALWDQMASSVTLV